MVLLQADQQQEAMELLQHGLGVLARDVPDHPLLQQFRSATGSTQTPNPSELAASALAKRRGEAPPATFADDLAHLREAGEPHATVASYLAALAEGGSPDEIPGAGGARSFDEVRSSIEPPEARTFLQRVREDALASDVASTTAAQDAQ